MKIFVWSDAVWCCLGGIVLHARALPWQKVEAPKSVATHRHWMRPTPNRFTRPPLWLALRSFSQRRQVVRDTSCVWRETRGFVYVTGYAHTTFPTRETQSVSHCCHAPITHTRTNTRAVSSLNPLHIRSVGSVSHDYWSDGADFRFFLTLFSINNQLILSTIQVSSCKQCFVLDFYTW